MQGFTQGVFRLLGCVAMAATLLIAGCESAPKARGRLDPAIAHYEAQRWDLAHERAMEVVRAPGVSVDDREQAGYLAGLAAFRAGNHSEAELRLQPLTAANNRNLRASAQAVMGQIRLEQNRYVEAAGLFESAASGLDGHDAQQAHRFAAIAHEQSGNLRAAEAARTAAERSGTVMRSGFTLQVGAFSERRRAERAAADAQSIATARGFGTVAVRPTFDSRGRALYLVQFGQFPTRQAAARAKEVIGRLEYIVTQARD